MSQDAGQPARKHGSKRHSSKKGGGGTSKNVYLEVIAAENIEG